MLVDYWRGTPDFPPAVWSKSYSEDENYFINKGREFFLWFSDDKRLSTDT
jgi:hypothetical protein